MNSSSFSLSSFCSIGLAVGQEKFVEDAIEVMGLLLGHMKGEGLPADDPQTSYLISAWSRFCKILGEREIRCYV